MTDKDLGGRPRIELSEECLKQLCEIQCTQEECGHVLGVSADTIDRRVKEWGYTGFAEYFKKNRGEGQMSLRRAQYLAAVEDRNPTMLVWMGKQILGQQDKQVTENTTNLSVTGLSPEAEALLLGGVRK